MTALTNALGKYKFKLISRRQKENIKDVWEHKKKESLK